MENKDILTDYYEITDYLFRREKIHNTKDFNSIMQFETMVLTPSLDAVRKAEDVVYWNTKDIESCERRINTYLDEIEKLRRSIKGSEKIISMSKIIIDLYNLQQDKKNS